MTASDERSVESTSGSMSCFFLLVSQACNSSVSPIERASLRNREASSHQIRDQAQGQRFSCSEPSQV